MPQGFQAPAAQSPVVAPIAPPNTTVPPMPQGANVGAGLPPAGPPGGLPAPVAQATPSAAAPTPVTLENSEWQGALNPADFENQV